MRKNVVKLDVSKAVIIGEIKSQLLKNSLDVNSSIIIGSFCYSLIYTDIDLFTYDEQVFSFINFSKELRKYNVKATLVTKEKFHNLVASLTFRNICMGIDLNLNEIVADNYIEDYNQIYYNENNTFTSIKQNIKVIDNIHHENERVKKAKKVEEYIYDNFNNDLEINYSGLLDVLKTTDKAMIAGGFFRDYILYRDMNHCKDLDIFVRDEETFNLLTEKLTSIGYEQNKNENKGRKLKNNKFTTPNGKLIDLVFMEEGITFTEILNTFDYTINAIGFVPKYNKIELPDFISTVYALEHVLSMRLVVTPCLTYKCIYPNRTITRLAKFIHNYYTIDSLNKTIFNDKIFSLTETKMEERLKWEKNLNRK